MKKLTVLSIFFLLAACLPAPQTQVTVAPTVTLTPTVVPTLTLTPIPTPTISPQVTALQEEIREFVPANGITFEESLSDLDSKLSSQAKQAEIYWDVIMSKIMDTKSIEENKEIHNQILADAELMEKHPEWKELSNNLPKESKKAYMTEFLKRSGGTMVIKDAKWQYHTVDFNQKVKFTVEEVPEITNEYPSVYNSIGFKQHVGEKGELTFSILTIKGVLSEKINGDGLWGNLTGGQLISSFFWEMVSGSMIGITKANSNASDYKLYIDSDPFSGRYFVSLGWSFIQ
jgi:hypothetical protein